ncbi:MAG: hypothetical protein QXN36_00840 [Candidatus Bathyarchaeia archaeon]
MPKIIGCEGNLTGRKSSDTQGLVRAIVVLLRNTTWRCGRLERSIVNHLHKRTAGFGKPEMPVKDMLQTFQVTGKKKNEFLDAIRRLERRNIIRILKF